MGKAHFCFGASFFILATFGTLLATWTIWWMAIVGPSVPAHRPFFQTPSSVPQLIQEASQERSGNLIFVYSLSGGWPTTNSVLRLLCSLLAIASSFSFALIAALVTHKQARRVFTAVLAVLALLAFAAAIADSVAIGRTARECARGKCIMEVPEAVIQSGNVCICAVSGWFHLTLVADLVLMVAAIICLVLTARPRFAAAVAYPS